MPKRPVAANDQDLFATLKVSARGLGRTGAASAAGSDVMLAEAARWSHTAIHWMPASVPYSVTQAMRRGFVIRRR